MGSTEGLTRWFSRTSGRLAIGIVMVVGALAATQTPAPLVAAAPTRITGWGSAGVAAGQFADPTGVGIDSAGNVYVVDSLNFRVQKFSPNGALLLTFGTGGAANGQFEIPNDVAVSPDDVVYVTDTGNYRVQRFTTSGAYLGKWGANGAGNGQFGLLYGIEVDSSGNVYVSDAGFTARIQKFTATGSFLLSWGGTKSSADGKFDTPAGLAIDAHDDVYVADNGNHRIQKFTSSGTFIRKWGTLGVGAGQMSSPIDVAVDGAGHVWVADAANDRVQAFTTDGTFVSTIGSLGSGNGQFDSPNGIGADDRGNVYVTDTGNDRVQRFGDRTRPTITMKTPGAGAVYARGRAVKASYKCVDEADGSGVAACTAAVPSGSLIDTFDVGDHVFTVTATDRAGNLRTNSYPYTVALARPDGLVQLGAKGEPIGDGRYSGASKQKRTTTITRGRSATFYVTIQNDARFPDRVRVTADGSNSDVSVRYRDAYGRDVTSAVASGTYRSTSLAPKASFVLAVRVTARPGAIVGHRVLRTIVARSATHTGRRDVVGAGVVIG